MRCSIRVSRTRVGRYGWYPRVDASSMDNGNGTAGDRHVVTAAILWAADSNDTGPGPGFPNAKTDATSIIRTEPPTIMRLAAREGGLKKTILGTFSRG